MVSMPDTNELSSNDLTHHGYVFSGHFHKRQVQGKIHYMGNAFPHNYADAWDDKRGMMILDKENNKEPEYIDWDNCPKYRTLKLSQLLEDKEKLLKSKMYFLSLGLCLISLNFDITDSLLMQPMPQTPSVG